GRGEANVDCAFFSARKEQRCPHRRLRPHRHRGFLFTSTFLMVFSRRTHQGGSVRKRTAWLVTVLVIAPVYLNAQWAVYRDPTIPRTKDGKPNLSAPAPRLGGKPDLTGIWQAESAPVAEIQPFLLPGGINGLGEDLPTKYFFNFFFD